MLAAALVLVSPVLRLQPLSMLGDALRQPAVCWCLGWGLFVLAMWPAMRGPVVHPVLSGLRPPAEVAHS
ncbi:MAG TPA: NnrS family protein, partial [Thauera sp.]|nr:NnrS family protein [Thauera sp.]